MRSADFWGVLQCRRLNGSQSWESGLILLAIDDITLIRMS